MFNYLIDHIGDRQINIHAELPINSTAIPISNNGIYSTVAKNIHRYLGIKNSEQINGGSTNLTWKVLDQNKSPQYLNLTVGIKENADIPSSNISGFTDVHKYEKCDLLAKLMQNQGVPVPSYIATGVYKWSGYNFGFGLQEEAQGTNLSSIWATLDMEEKKVLASQLPLLIDKITTVQAGSPLSYKKADLWYLDRMASLLLTARKYGIFSEDACRAVEEGFRTALTKAQPKDIFGVTHGDLINKNLFVSEQNGLPVITGVIDWESANLNGHSGWDYSLAPWWMAGEHGGDVDVYKIASSIKDGLLPHFSGNFDDAISLSNLLWYTTAIVDFSILQRPEKIDRRKRKLINILNCLNEERNYTGFKF